MDDLDDLLNSLGDAAGAPPPRQQSYAPPPAGGGDELDDLLNDLGGGAPPSRQQSYAQPAARQQSYAQPAAAGGGDDLDALLNDLGGGAPAARQQSYAQPPRQQTMAPPAAGGGDDLDALLNDLGGGAPAAAPAARQQSYAQPPQQRQQSMAPAAAGGGDDLDDLLNDLGAPPAQSRPAAQPSFGGPGQQQQRGMGGGQPMGGMGGMGGGQPMGGMGGGARGPSMGGDDDLDLMLKGLSNQMANIDDGAPTARGMCSHCQRPILGEIIQAMNKAFHPECFVCGNCQEPLGTRNFYEADGRPNCEKCYQSLFCSMCSRCNKSVLDRCITAMGKKWHVECFICAKCNAPFPDGMFFEKEGQPWCKNCHSQNFSYRCSACNQGIAGDVVNALGRHWHPQCFVCAHCRMPFEGGTFFAKEGRPFCRQHYNMQSGATCGGCGMPITGRVVEGLGRKWCPEHFVCAFCNLPLTGGGYQEHEGRPYCRNCSQRMF